jgi:hypothetical protein
MVIGGLNGISVGAILGFSAILLPQLPDNITLSDKSWIGMQNNLTIWLEFEINFDILSQHQLASVTWDNFLVQSYPDSSVIM